MKSWLVVVSALVVAFCLAPAASAEQSPADCVGTEPTVQFSKATLDQLSGPVRQGDSIELMYRIANDGPFTCFLDDIRVAVRVPNPDGTPGATRASGGTVGLAGGTSVEGSSLGVDPYVVNLQEGVFDAQLEISWTATLRQGGQDTPISGQGIGAGLQITRPRAALTVTSNPPVGVAPMVATSTYLLTNSSPAPPKGETAPAMVPTGPNGIRDLISDAGCGPVTYVSGDDATDERPVLDPGETWKFTCTRAYARPGFYSSQASITGTSAVDGRAWPQAVNTDGISPVRVYGPDLVVDKSHKDDLYAGGTGDYSLRVTNSGNLTTDGTVTVADQLPDGLSATAIFGSGWDCDLPSLTCSRQDQLGSGKSFPNVTVTVATAADPPASVINRASVSGGGEADAVKTNNSAADPTTIRNPAQPTASVNRFIVGPIKTRTDGTVVVKVIAPTPGKLAVDDQNKQLDLVERSTRRVRASGTYTIKVGARPRLRRQLTGEPNGRRVKLKITFRPKGGSKLSLIRTARFRLL